MAVPLHLTTQDISGRYTMNKTLSDMADIDKMLALQGIGWFKRKAITIATITLTIKHYTNDQGIEHIDIANHITGGIPGSREERPLDAKGRENNDIHFGPTVFQTQRIQLEAGDLNDFLKSSWTQDTIEHGLIHTTIKSDTKKSGTTWVESHTWGFEEKNGERRYTRHVDFTGPKGEHIQCLMYFDYVGP